MGRRGNDLGRGGLGGGIYTNAGTRPDGITFSAPGGGDNTPNGVMEFETRGTVAEDLAGDHDVDAADVALMFAHWGLSGTRDLDGDGIVDAAHAEGMFGTWTGDATPPVNAVPELASCITTIPCGFLARRSRNKRSQP